MQVGVAVYIVTAEDTLVHFRHRGVRVSTNCTSGVDVYAVPHFNGVIFLVIREACEFC